MPKQKKPINIAIETAQREMLDNDNPPALRLRWYDRYAVLQKLLDIKLEGQSAGRPKDTEVPVDLTVPASPETPEAPVEGVPTPEAPWDAMNEFLDATPEKSLEKAREVEAARKRHLETSRPQFDDLALMRNEHVGVPATKSKDDWQ